MAIQGTEIIGVEKTKIREILKEAGIELFLCENCLRLMPEELNRWNKKEQQINCPDCIEE